MCNGVTVILISPRMLVILRVAGHRAWDPPEPVPNSEVKLRSVSGCSTVFGRAKPEKPAALFETPKFNLRIQCGGKILKVYYPLSTVFH